MLSTPSLHLLFNAVPAIDRLRLIAGSVPWKKSRWDRRPSLTRIVDALPPLPGSTIAGTPMRAIESAVRVISSGSVLLILRMPRW